MDYGFLFIALACVFGLFMAWGVGANDVANAMSTSVGSRAITVKQAIIIAAIFEFAGAYLAGGEVTATIRNGMLDTASIADTPEILVFGMLDPCWQPGLGCWSPRSRAGRCPRRIPSSAPLSDSARSASVWTLSTGHASAPS